MLLQGFQKLLQFLELRQLLEWTQGQSDPCPDPLPNAVAASSRVTTTENGALCRWPWRLWGKPTVGVLCLKYHHQPATLWVKNGLVPATLKEKSRP